MTWTIEQITDKRGRRYVIKDEAGETQTLPSVTTILGGALPKGGLEYWGARLALEYASTAGVKKGTDLDDLYATYKTTEFSPYKALKKAGGRGTDVHAVFERLIRDGKLDDLPAGTAANEGYVDAVVKWHTELAVDTWTPIAVEELLFSATHRYAGQCDAICRRADGTVMVVDLKTSKNVYESHLIQLAAYKHAAIEMGLFGADEPCEMHVVRVSPEGEYEAVRSQHDVDDFLAVKAVFHLLRDKSKKGVPV